MGGGGGVGGSDGSDSSSGGGGGSFNFFLFSSKHKPFILYNFKQWRMIQQSICLYKLWKIFLCKSFSIYIICRVWRKWSVWTFFLIAKERPLAVVITTQGENCKRDFCKNFCNDFTILPRNTRKQKQKNITHNIVMMGMF